MVIVSIISAIIIFSIIVIIHECGHYFSAKRHWVKIEEFWLWLHPKWKVLWKNKAWTEFTLNWIPFWGFVRMQWENWNTGSNLCVNHDLKNTKPFYKVSLLWRMEIVLAWIFMNFMLAWWILIILFTIWTKPIILSKDDFVKYQNEWYIVMDEKFEWVKILNNPENFLENNKIFFQKGDIIKKINWEKIFDAKKFINIQKNFFEENKNFLGDKNFFYEILRWEKILNLEIKISDLEKTWWKLWISISSKPWIKEIKNIEMSFVNAVQYSFNECFRISISTVKMFWEMLWKIFTEWKTPDWVSWPVWIAKAAWWLVEEWDFNWLLKFMALISLSLAVVNILPIPALDWWRFMFLIIEWITRRPLSANLENYVNLFWYLFLMWLLILVTIKDILAIF